MQSGIILAKLKMFPKSEMLHLKHNSLRTIDLDAIQTGGLPKVSIIWLDGNNFDEKWLEQKAEKVLMRVEGQPFFESISLWKKRF